MIKVLMMIAGEYKIKLLRVCLISILEAVFSAIPFVILYFLISDILNKELSMDKLWLYIFAILGAAIIRSLFSYLGVTQSRSDGTNMIKDLRLRIGEHIRKLPLGYFNSKNLGELCNTTLDNVNKAEMILTMLLPELITGITLNVFLAIVLLFIDVNLAIATIITMPVALFLLVKGKKIMKIRGKCLYESSNDLTNSIIEFVSGIKIIKSFNSSNKKLNDLCDKMRDFKVKSLQTEGTLSPIMVLAGISIDLGLVSLIIIGSKLLLDNNLEATVFIVFLVLSARFFENLKTISINYIKVKYLMIAGQNINDVFKEDTMKGEKISINQGDIKIENLSFAYNHEYVLHNVNCSIKKNSLTALVGPSGSGKSTLVGLIGRFYDPQQGKISIGESNIKDVDPEALLKGISVVFQKVILFNDTIMNNIKLGNDKVTKEQVINACKEANCHDFISKLPNGYDTVVNDSASNLSGGEKLRIAIARAFLKDASLVLLDEATSSLDPENEYLIQQAISKLIENKTVVVIAHRLKTIQNAEKIIVLDKGRIREQGSHCELLENSGLYKQMWDSQEESSGWNIDR